MTAFKQVKPFLKWVGGKQKALPSLKENYPVGLGAGKIKRYIEPFLGGGAVLFDILQTYNIDEVIVGDMNSDLIATYEAVKNNVEELFEQLEFYQNTYDVMADEQREEFYYIVRERFNKFTGKSLSNKERVEQAARFIFLNKTCFNGLYRVNKSGFFNVPVGRYKSPKILDEEKLFNVSALLQNVQFYIGDYQQMGDMIDEETFVYLDPPYRPISATSSFREYCRSGFNDDHQRELAAFYREMSKRGAFMMLSNSDPNDGFFDELYGDYQMNRIQANRSLNCDATKRGKVSELLIISYLND